MFLERAVYQWNYSLKFEMLVSRNSICDQMFEVNYTFPIISTMFPNSLGYCMPNYRSQLVFCIV